MKGTEHFKDIIQNYWETRASYDELFAKNFRKENKNIDECITYILTEIPRMRCTDLSDEDIKLTEEEKAEARKKTIERHQAEEFCKLTAKKPKAEKQVEQQIAQPSLFEF